MAEFAWRESALIPKFAVVELANLFSLMSPSFPVASAVPSVECKPMTVPLHRCLWPGAHHCLIVESEIHFPPVEGFD